MEFQDHKNQARPPADVSGVPANAEEGEVIPRTINQVWFGNPPHDAFSRTIRAKNPEMGYRLWREDSVKELGLDLCALAGHLGNWASVSNYVRLVILKKLGGAYLDLDFKCHDSLEPLFAAGSAVAAKQPDGRVCNAFLIAEPNHPWICWQIDHWNDFNQKDAASGVYLADAAPRELVTLVDTALVYPWAHDDPPGKRFPRAESILSHYWSGDWSKI